MYDISVFAERLIAERKKKKLTQSELAEKAKMRLPLQMRCVSLLSICAVER